MTLFVFQQNNLEYFCKFQPKISKKCELICCTYHWHALQQKYYYQMSIASQRDDEMQPRSQQPPLHNTDVSSQQIAEYFEQKIGEIQSSMNEQQQQQFQEDAYKDLSSGVYQMSSESYRQEVQQEQTQNLRQQIELGNHPQKAAVDQDSCTNELDVEPRIEGCQMTEPPVEQFMSKVLSPKLAPQVAPQLKPQDGFVYPSLMEQSHVENECKVEQQMPKQVQGEQAKTQSQQHLKQASDDKLNVNMKVRIKPQQVEIKCNEGQKQMNNQDLLDIRQEQKPKVTFKQFNSNRLQEKATNQQTLCQKVQPGALDEGVKLRILGYQKQYFIKIETQVYQIQFCSKTQNYTFNRKFSDFVELDRLIRLKYPGYILYPFPQNSLEFFKKIKLSVGTELEKAILLEKRLLELEKYLNFMLKHKQLGSSQIFSTFMIESDEQFTERMAYLQAMLEKEQQKLSQSRIKQNYKNIKNLVISGLSYFTDYMSKKKQNSMDSTLLAQIRRKCEVLRLSYAEVYVDLEKYRLFTGNIQIKAEKLLQIYQSNIAMKPIESSIDSVLRLSSKMASSNTAYQIQKSWVEDYMLAKIYFFAQIFAQVEEQIEYRKSLLQKADLIEQQAAKLGLSIIERVNSFDSRFVQDWLELKSKFEREYFEMVNQFSNQWQLHRSQMSKIWK